jgi:glycosidase
LSNKEHLIPIYSLLYTLPGIPSIYYGSEWGIEGKKVNNSDDPLRPAISIEDNGVTNNNVELTKFICELGEMKKENAKVLLGRYKELMLTNRQYAFTRYTNDEAIVTIVNNDDNEAVVNVPLQVPFVVESAKNAITNELIEIQNNQIHMDIMACNAVIIKIN